MKRLTIRILLSQLVLLTGVGGASATGLLIPTDRRVSPLAIKYHRATVKIQDRVAVTHVDQVFVNHTDRDLEATYLFPLPKGATVSDFYLYVNGKRTKGEILEKHRARNIYEGIVRRMRDPGLIEYLGRDLFQCRVYPVPKRGEQRLEIQFTQLMPFEAGLTKYAYPMRIDRASGRTLQDFTLSVSIASKTPIKTIYSPSHQIYSRKKDDHHAVAGFEKSAALLDRDFELFFSVSEKDIGLNLLTHRGPGEPGFFLLMASPKSQYTQGEIIGKRISFVIDTSGSMAGAKMRHAKQALKYCLGKLNSDDVFNVVRFSTDVEAFEKKPVSASRANVQRALGFVERMQAAGGTAIDEALSTALSGHVKRDEPNLVVFLTDGHPTVGETDPHKIITGAAQANQVRAKLFVFGVGEEINTHLLDRLSGQAGGDSTYTKPDQEIERTLSAFYDKVSHPVLTDLDLDFGKIHEYDVLPKKLPDLFKGSQLIVLGRYRNDGHTALTLNGQVGSKRRRFVFEGAFAKKNKANEFIPRLWATRKIGYLLDNIRLGGERKELVDEVIRLSKRYGIVTPYTSYLVTEDTPQLARPTSRPRPRPPLAPRPGTLGLDRIGGTGKGADARGAQPQASAPADAAPSLKKSKSRMRVFSRKAEEVMAEKSGESAVHLADAVREMKSAGGLRVEDDEVSGIRYAAERAFRFRNGVWVDLKFKRSRMRVLKVKYLGKAYFELMVKSSQLKKAFALGERVIVVVAKDKAIEIGPDGRDKVPAAELRAYLP